MLRATWAPVRRPCLRQSLHHCRAAWDCQHVNCSLLQSSPDTWLGWQVQTQSLATIRAPLSEIGLWVQTQVSATNEEAHKVVSFYRVQSLPSILLVDPVTGACLQSFQGFVEADRYQLVPACKLCGVSLPPSSSLAQAVVWAFNQLQQQNLGPHDDRMATALLKRCQLSLSGGPLQLARICLQVSTVTAMSSAYMDRWRTPCNLNM